jgi:hypothetical protein
MTRDCPGCDRCLLSVSSSLTDHHVVVGEDCVDIASGGRELELEKAMNVLVTDRHRKLRRERQARVRQRRKQGVVVVPVEVNADVIEYLVTRKWLGDDVTNPRQIGAALAHFIGEIIRTAVR